jgi:hypothetical protein
MITLPVDLIALVTAGIEGRVTATFLHGDDERPFVRGHWIMIGPFRSDPVQLARLIRLDVGEITIPMHRMFVGCTVHAIRSPEEQSAHAEAIPEEVIAAYLEQARRPSQNDAVEWAERHYPGITRGQIRNAYPTDRRGKSGPRKTRLHLVR